MKQITKLFILTALVFSTHNSFAKNAGEGGGDIGGGTEKPKQSQRSTSKKSHDVLVIKTPKTSKARD